jgi:GxxExxY protein
MEIYTSDLGRLVLAAAIEVHFVEIKTVEKLLPIHQAQLLTYLRLTHLRQGFLLNFNSRRLMDGVKSLLN